MKITALSILILALIISACDTSSNADTGKAPANALEGTWQLISGTIIENGDTTVTDYTKNQSMIKIINGSHFAFLNHDLKNGKDSTASFSAGGGVYTLEGDQYTEYLEYCNAREWEGHTFQFTVIVRNDTLIQQGVEKIENINVDRLNIEKYSRIRDN
jgi:hypothetical protein